MLTVSWSLRRKKSGSVRIGCGIKIENESVRERGRRSEQKRERGGGRSRRCAACLLTICLGSIFSCSDVVIVFCLIVVVFNPFSGSRGEKEYTFPVFFDFLLSLVHFINKFLQTICICNSFKYVDQNDLRQYEHTIWFLYLIDIRTRGIRRGVIHSLKNSRTSHRSIMNIWETSPTCCISSFTSSISFPSSRAGPSPFLAFPKLS